MRYLPCWKQINITLGRYEELKGFCKQYDDWKEEARSLLGISALNMDGMPHGTGKSDPVARAAERRERLLAKISIIDGCAKAGGEEWAEALIEHICRCKPWKVIKETNGTILPTSDANAFYRHRREFFEMLNKVTDI